MANYWDTRTKRFCDICKTWITDNKLSIDAHEKGKRHNENVAQNLKQISRQTIKDNKERLKMEADLKKIEAAAMKAFMKDVEANADYSSQILNKHLNAESGAGERTSSVDDNNVSVSKKNVEGKRDAEIAKDWYEAVSGEGHSYYWNVQTGESVWEPPSCGYVSLAVQKAEKKESKRQNRKKAKERLNKEEQTVRRREEGRSHAGEQRAFSQEEQKRSKTVVDEPEHARSFFGSLPKGNSLGKWKTIKHREERSFDQLLPKQKPFICKASGPNRIEPEIKFKEISAGTLQGNDTLFKKRKLSSSCKANRRRRTEDD